MKNRLTQEMNKSREKVKLLVRPEHVLHRQAQTREIQEPGKGETTSMYTTRLRKRQEKYKRQTKGVGLTDKRNTRTEINYSGPSM